LYFGLFFFGDYLSYANPISFGRILYFGLFSFGDYVSVQPDIMRLFFSCLTYKRFGISGKQNLRAIENSTRSSLLGSTKLFNEVIYTYQASFHIRPSSCIFTFVDVDD
jgi:hypothetical protein